MMLGLHHRHQPLPRERLLPQPKPVQLHEFGQEVGSSQEASQSSRTFSPSCDVAAARHSACPIGSDLFASRAVSDAPMHPPAPKTTLAQLTHPGHISGCPPTEWPWSCTTPPGSDGATRVFLPCVDNTSATTAAAPSASRYPSAWQTLMAATQATTAYAASVQQAQQLLRDFEGYQRSVSASPLNHDQRRAKLTPGCLESGSGSAGTTNCPRLDVDALGQRGTPSAIISTKARESVPSVGTGHAAQPPHASPSSSPYLSFPLDPATYELARRRSLQALHDNAQARAACIDQGLRLSRAVHAGLLKRPGMVIGDVVTMEGSSGHPKSTAVAHNDGQALLPAAGAGHTPQTSNAAAGQQTTDQPPIAAVPVMSVAERAAATAEAERALSLLCTIRAVRRQTEELTVLLLHACGEWGCWSVPTAEEGVAWETTRTPLPSPLPGCIRHSQHLFADLFMAAPLAPTAFCTSSSGSLVGVSDGPAKADLLDLSAAEDADPARLSAASVFAKESACRRERACRVLRQALQQQPQRWPLSTAAAATATLAAGAAFLEMALAPPQRAVPPPPPMSVQLDLYAVQPCALQRSIQEWRRRAAQTTATGATKAGGTPPPEEAASLHGSLQQLLHTLGRQRPQLQRSYDVLHAAAGQRHRTNTHSCTDEQRGVPPREATTGVITAAEARAVVHKTHGTSAAVSDAPQEVEAPLLPSSSPPLAVAPDTLRRTPSSLPRQHSSTTSSSSSQALPSSDTLLSSPVQLAVDHTRLWADPPTPLQRTDFSCAAAAAPTSTEISERGARIPVHQAGRSVLEAASSHRAKGKPELEARIEVEVIGGNADGSHAAAGASPSNSTHVTNMRRTSLSSSTLFHSPVAVDARGGVVGALREVYEASWQPCANARPSTRPEAAHAVAVAEEKLASQHQEERRRRRCDRGGSATAAELEDSVRRHLTRWISQQQKRTASDAAASLSSLALSPHDLSTAAAWLRSTSPRFAISQTAAAPPPAVVRILKHAFPDFVAPSSWNTLRAATTAAVVAEADQPDGDEEPRAPQQPQGHPPSSTITSTTPSHPYSAATSSAPGGGTAAKAVASAGSPFDGSAVSHSPMSSMQSSRAPSGGNHTAAVAPPGRLLLAPVAAANPRPAPLSAPPPPPPASLPKAKPAKDGGSAGVTKLPQRQRHRSFFSRLFRCGG